MKRKIILKMVSASSTPDPVNHQVNIRSEIFVETKSKSYKYRNTVKDDIKNYNWLQLAVFSNSRSFYILMD